MADDFAELRELAADLTAAPEEARPFIRKAIQVTAHKIKDDWRKGANRSGLHKYAADITYETKEKASEIEAEIGPTIGDSGSFGLVEDAGGGVKSAPQHAGRDAKEANEQDFVDGLELAIFDGLRAAIEKG